MHDTLVIICRDIGEAQQAANRLLPSPRLERFFVFLGEKPGDDSLGFLTERDSHITLEGASSWSPNPLHAGIRAALLYATGWNLIFCTGTKPATDGQLSEVLAGIESKGNINLSECWGASREHLALNGFECIFPTAKSLTISKPEQARLDTSVDAMTLIRAMAGQAVAAHGVLAALGETVPLRAAILDKSVYEPDEPYMEFLSALAELSQEKNSRFPSVVILGTLSMPFYLTEQVKSMPGTGAVVLLVNEHSSEAEYLARHTPYRRFRCSDGWDALVFRGEG